MYGLGAQCGPICRGPIDCGSLEDNGESAVGPGSEKTFDSQGTYILPVVGRRAAFIFVADRWNSNDLTDSRYVWLPIIIRDGKLEIRWRDHWDLSVFN